MFAAFSLTSHPTSMRISSLVLENPFNHKPLLPACLYLNLSLKCMQIKVSGDLNYLRSVLCKSTLLLKKFSEKQISALGLLPTFCLIVYK